MCIARSPTDKVRDQLLSKLRLRARLGYAWQATESKKKSEAGYPNESRVVESRSLRCGRANSAMLVYLLTRVPI
jgi:hypothetical protein